MINKNIFLTSTSIKKCYFNSNQAQNRFDNFFLKNHLPSQSIIKLNLDSDESNSNHESNRYTKKMAPKC